MNRSCSPHNTRQAPFRTIREFALPAAIAVVIHASALCLFWFLAGMTGTGDTESANGLSNGIAAIRITTSRDTEHTTDSMKRPTGEKTIAFESEQGKSETFLSSEKEETRADLREGADHGADFGNSGGGNAAIDTSARGIGTRSHGPVPIEKFKAIYPRRAREEGIEGVVVVRISVDEKGAQCAVGIDASSGDPLLDASALNAARQWKFSPAVENGAPAKGNVVVSINFVLE